MCVLKWIIAQRCPSVGRYSLELPYELSSILLPDPSVPNTIILSMQTPPPPPPLLLFRGFSFCFEHLQKVGITP